MLSMDEFQAIIDERWLQHQAPLLILCVVPNADAPCIPVLHVANQLNLAQLTRRWQVFIMCLFLMSINQKEEWF